MSNHTRPQLNGKTWAVLAAAFIGVEAATSWAVDQLPPCWRGRAGTTFQQWTFSSAANPAAPDLATNPYGPAAASIVVGPFGEGWLHQLAGLGTNISGYWDLGQTGSITLALPNQPAAPPGTSKEIWIQITQYSDLGPFRVPASIAIAGATYLGGQQLIVDQGALGRWILDQTRWRLETSPPAETIIITASTNGGLIDEIVVDTRSIEPGCPAELRGEADPGQCARSNVAWALPEADGCTVTNVSCSPPPGSTFPVGTTPVLCVSTDAWGAATACAFQVIVEDPAAAQLRLAIRRLGPTNNLLELSWPWTCLSNVLEQTVILPAETNWVPVPGPFPLLEGRYWLTTNCDGPTRFFRLRRP